MKYIAKQSGFTAVELLITLFIAAAFLMSGYQLYSLIIKDAGETRATARASNVADDYLQRYKTSATNPCVEKTVANGQAPLNNQSISVTGLATVTVTVEITCPYSSSPTPITSVSKVLVTLKYNNPQKTINNATYVKP